jgi:RHS repeat-associated protein
LSGTLNQSLDYTYNDDFNLTSLTYAGVTESYAYDNDGLLTAAGNFTISRNAGNGLPETVTGGALSLSRTFNGYAEVEAQDYSIGGQNLTSWNLTRDDNGRVTNKSENFGGTTSNYDYTYDAMGRLLTVTKDNTLVEEYQYDANGTRIYEMNSLRGIAGRSFSYDDEDHLLTAGSVVYSYNLDGFLTAKTDGSDVTTYDYSSQGELLVVTLPDGRIIEYVHDPLGRRIAKKVNSVTVEKYLWQGLTRLLAVYDGSNNLMMRFEYADDRMPVAMTRGGATYSLTYDQVGSLRIVADASGNVVKRIEYDSFGNIIGDTDPSFEVPFGFAGGLHDRDTGLVRFGFRDYDPDIGRWTVKDPIFFAGGDTDLYGYCLNNPINFFDPLGLYLTPSQKVKVSVASGIGSAVGYAVGTLAGAPNLGSGLGGLVASAIAAKSMEGSTWQDVANSAISGALSGLTGASIGSLLRGTLMNSIRAATVTGVTSGMFDAMLLGADPIFKEPDAKNTPCK